MVEEHFFLKDLNHGEAELHFVGESGMLKEPVAL